MIGLLKKWFAELTKSNQRRPASRPSRNVRLGLESLETRMVPTLMMEGFAHAAPAREVLSFAGSQPPAQVRVVAPTQVHITTPAAHAISHPTASSIEAHPSVTNAGEHGHVAINAGVRPNTSPRVPTITVGNNRLTPPAHAPTTIDGNIHHGQGHGHTKTTSLANKDETAKQGHGVPPKHSENANAPIWGHSPILSQLAKHSQLAMHGATANSSASHGGSVVLDEKLPIEQDKDGGPGPRGQSGGGGGDTGDSSGNSDGGIGGGVSGGVGDGGSDGGVGDGGSDGGVGGSDGGNGGSDGGVSGGDGGYGGSDGRASGGDAGASPGYTGEPDLPIEPEPFPIPLNPGSLGAWTVWAGTHILHALKP